MSTPPFPEESDLHRAVLEEQPQRLAQLLLREGVREKLNPLGFTALDLAQLLDRPAALELLQAALPPPKIPLLLPGERVRRLYSLPTLEAKTGLHYLRFPKFQDYALLKRAIRYLPYSLSHGSLREQCRALAQRYQGALFQGECADMSAVWINAALGFGLMTNRSLEAEYCVGVYTGVVRPLDWYGATANAWCWRYPQAFFSPGSLVIDAQRESNLLRFANHSSTPNLTPHYAIANRIVYLLLITNQFVPRGAYLTVDYGKDYWRWRKPLP